MKREDLTYRVEDVLIYSDMASMLIDPKYTQAILRGEKTSTIRDRIRLFPPNCIINLRYSENEPPIKIKVKNYKVKLLKHITIGEVRQDGFKCKEDFINEIRKYYPNCDSNTVITVIKFKVL